MVAVVRPGKTPEEAEKLLYESLEHYKTTAVTPEELAKARMLNRRGQIQSMQSTLSRAIQLGDDAVNFGDPEIVWNRVDRYNAVTPAEVQRVARQYLTETNRNVIITMPKPKATAPAKSGN